MVEVVVFRALWRLRNTSTLRRFLAAFPDLFHHHLIVSLCM